MGGWVLVGDRLPENQEQVRTYKAVGKYHDYRYGYVVCDETETVWFESWTGETIHPTHWRPLAAPPEVNDASR